MNSSIQCLYSSPSLVGAISNYQGECILTQLLKDPSKNIASILAHFKQFQIGTPHDSQEALLAIIDVIEKSLGKDLFYGKTVSKYISKTESTETIGEYGMLIFHPTSDTDLETLFNEYEKMEYIIKPEEFVCKKITHTSFPNILLCMFWNRRNIKLPETFKERKLRSVIIHIGHETAGHYVALVRQGDEWFLTNDEQIEKIELPTNMCPYLALYSD
jgi:hypothetical protein